MLENQQQLREPNEVYPPFIHDSLPHAVFSASFEDQRALRRSRMNNAPDGYYDSFESSRCLPPLNVHMSQNIYPHTQFHSSSYNFAPCLLNKKEKYFVYIYMKLINNHVPIITKRDLEGATFYISNQYFGASKLEEQRVYALRAILWGCLSIGANISGDKNMMAYAQRCRDSLKHCFDAPCVETLRANLIASLFWAQIDETEMRNRYAKFAELISHEIPYLPLSLSASLQYIKATIHCSNQHEGQPMTVKEQFNMKLQPDPVFPKSIPINPLNPQLFVLTAITFSLNGLQRASICSPKLRKTIEDLLFEALESMAVSKSRNGWFCDVAAVSVRGLLGYIQLIDGRESDAFESLRPVVSAALTSQYLPMLPVTWHSCQTAAHLLHHFRVKQEYNELATKLNALQGKLPFSSQSCILPIITASWNPICTKNYCSSFVCQLFNLANGSLEMTAKELASPLSRDSSE